MAFKQYYKSNNKYHAQTTTYNGLSYDSKLEASHAMELDMRLKAGEIKSVERQVRVEINCAWYSGKPTLTLVKRLALKEEGIEFEKICDLIMDFVVYNNDGSITYFESKGYPTELWKNKWKLLDIVTRNHPFITIEVHK